MLNLPKNPKNKNKIYFKSCTHFRSHGSNVRTLYSGMAIVVFRWSVYCFVVAWWVKSLSQLDVDTVQTLDSIRNCHIFQCHVGNYRLDRIHIVRIQMVVSKLEFRYLWKVLIARNFYRQKIMFARIFLTIILPGRQAPPTIGGGKLCLWEILGY